MIITLFYSNNSIPGMFTTTNIRAVFRKLMMASIVVTHGL